MRAVLSWWKKYDLTIHFLHIVINNQFACDYKVHYILFLIKNSFEYSIVSLYIKKILNISLRSEKR